LIDVDPDRACASVIETGSVLSPGVVPAETVALKENTLSPALVSPAVAPSSKNC
jgi:hypothetical protein